MALAAARAIIRSAATRRTHAHSSIGLAHAAAARLSLPHPSASLRGPFGGLLGPSRLFASSSGGSSSSSLSGGSSGSSACGPSVVRQLQSRLVACLRAQDAPGCEALIRSFEAEGGRVDLPMLNAWLGCFLASADWRGAERAWQRISELKLHPDRVSYRNLIKTYVHRGSTAQLAKIAPLLSEMQDAQVRFDFEDFQQLIKTAHVCDKPNVAQTWIEMAKEAGLSEQMEQYSKRIAAAQVQRRAPREATPTRTAATGSDPAAASQLAAVILRRRRSKNRPVAATAPPASTPPCSVDPLAAALARAATPITPTRAATPTTTAVPAADVLKADLKACLATADSARALQLLRAFEQRGGQCTVEMLNVAMGCHKHPADWQGAERVWKRIKELKLRPSDVTCRTLIEVYTHAGGAQLGKVKSVLAYMKRNDLRFDVEDLEQLIKTAYACDKPTEVGRWVTRADRQDMFRQLDHAARQIAQITAAKARASSGSVVAASQPSTAAASASSPISTEIPAAQFQLATSPASAPARRTSRPAINRAALMALLHGEAPLGVALPAVEAAALFTEASLPAAPVAAASVSPAASSSALAAAVAEETQSSLALPAELVAYFADSDRGTLIALDLAIYRKSIIERMRSDSSDAELTAQIDSLVMEMQAAQLTFAVKDFGVLIKNAHLRKLPSEVRRWSDHAREAGVFEQLDHVAKRLAARAVAEENAALTAAAVPAATNAAAPASSSSSPPSVAAAPSRPAPAAPVSTDPAVIWRELQSCVLNGASSRAEQIVHAVHQRGGAWNASMIEWWLGSCVKHGDSEGAERAWAFMLECKQPPTHVSYCKLMQVYLHDRTRAQLAKTGALLIAMQNAGIAFTVRDYEQLIKCAHACKLPAQERRWTDMARSAGLFEELDGLSRALVERPANRDPNAPSIVLPLPVAPSMGMKKSTAALAVQTQLLSCVPLGDSARAQQLLREFEQTGEYCDVSLLNLWMACHRHAADWQGAERVWKRIQAMRLKPDRTTFALLIEIYLRDGHQPQLAKIDPLLVSMRQKQINFTLKDYQRLIQAANKAALTAQVRKLSDHARAAGWFDKLDQATRTIADAVAPQQPDVPLQPVDRAAAVSSLLHGKNFGVALSSAAPLVAAERVPTQAASSAEPFAAAAAAAAAEKTAAQKDADAVAAWAAADPAPATAPATAVSSMPEARTFSSASPVHAAQAELEPATFVLSKTASAAPMRGSSAALGSRTVKSPRVVKRIQLRGEAVSAEVADQSAPATSAPAEQPALMSSGIPVHTASALSAWLKCFANSGDWKGAERLWQQAAELRLKLKSRSPYRNLILVYLSAGGDHFAKIDALLSQMPTGVSFTAKDYEVLILACVKHQRPEELRRWIGAAQAARLFEKITAHLREKAEKALALNPSAIRSSLVPPERATAQSTVDSAASPAANPSPEATVEVQQSSERSAAVGDEDNSPVRPRAVQLNALEAATAEPVQTQRNKPVEAQPQPPQKSRSTPVAALSALAPRSQTSPRGPRSSKPLDSPSQMELELARAIVRSLAALEQHPFRMDHSTAMMQ